MTNPNNGRPVQMPMPEIIAGSERLAVQFESWDETTTVSEATDMVRRLAKELDRCSAYASQMWHQLDHLAAYLREDIARNSGVQTVLRDDSQRTKWADLYATTLSLLAGARGDNGFGAEQAHSELQRLDR